MSLQLDDELLERLVLSSEDEREAILSPLRSADPELAARVESQLGEIALDTASWPGTLLTVTYTGDRNECEGYWLQEVIGRGGMGTV